MNHVVVVGSSLAGLRACETLRTEGFEGTISLIGAESELPYDRPPLSKKFLAGDWESDRIRLRKQESFDALDLSQHLGVAATALDVPSRTVTCSDGSMVHGDAVIIATGTACRRLPNQPSVDGLFELRTLADAAALRQRLTPEARIVVIGAGFIGLEVAATAKQRGCHVTVLEAGPSPLIRALGVEMGAAVASVHQRNGVELRCGVQIVEIVGDSHVTGVLLGDGQLVPADVVVVGIGVSPSTGWLDGSGLTIRDGVVCDQTLQAAPAVYAAGDCARWTNRLFGEPLVGEEMRVEHWTNAAEQGAAAAKNLVAVASGEPPTPYAPVPFFWSDQFESRIQFVGRAHGDDQVHLFAGSVDGSFAALYGYDGRLRGALGVSMPKMVMPFRALIAARATWDEAVAVAGSMLG